MMGNLTNSMIERNRYVCIPLWCQNHSRQCISSSSTWHPTLDLEKLPPELALSILSNLNATDLCLASCVWKDLAYDDLLWRKLCFEQWSFMRTENPKERVPMTYRQLYLHLDEARLIFNSNASNGIQYLIGKNVLRNTNEDISAYLNAAPGLCSAQRWNYLEQNPDVMDKFIKEQNFKRQFLPDALRFILSRIASPSSSLQPVSVLERFIDKFSERFIQCNPNLHFTKDHVYLLCFSLILLSVDLSSPHVKNKMSKREFIRNTRDATGVQDSDFLGYLYDNVYTNGHIASEIDQKPKKFLPVINPSVIALERLVSVHAH